MKRGLLISLTICILILVSFAVYAVTTASDLGIQHNNIARIVDLTNDGLKDILAFSDKIDSRERPIQLYVQDKNTFALSKILDERNLKRCSLSYNDFNNNSYLDIFYTCFNQSNQLVSNLLLFNGTNYTAVTLDNHTTKTLSANAYGDTLFLDFTNNGYPDILSCFHGSNSLTLFESNGTHFTKKDSGISTEYFLKDNIFQNCFLLPLDFDGDGDIDIITYRYDSNTFALYNNTNCNQTICTNNSIPFVKVTDPNAFNLSYFSDKKIKHLQSFDTNQNGYSDLYYIVDTSNLSGSPRNISFGYMLNNRLHQSFQPTISTPSFQTLQYHHVSPKYFNLSWLDYEEDTDFIEIVLNTSTFNLNPGRSDIFALTYNVNITQNNITIYGDLPISNYDHHSGHGNFLKRTSANISMYPTCFDASAQAIGPSKLFSNQSSITQFAPELTVNGTTFRIELCDGLDTNCDGIIDGPFNFTWPDGKNTTIHLNQEFFAKRSASGIVQQELSFTHPENSNWKVTFDCSEKIAREGVKNITFQNSNSGSSPGATFTTAPPPPPETQQPDEETSTGDENNEPEPQSTPQPSQPQYSQELTIEKLISSLTNNSIRHTQIVQHTRTHTIIKDTFRNIGLFPLDFLVFMDFPKDILPSLQHFQTNKDFEIIAENPEIVFSATQVGSYRDFSIEYSLPNRLTDEQIQSISYSIVIESEKDYSDVEQSIADTKDVLNVTQSFRTTEDQTIFTIDLNLDSNAILTNLSIYQEIPKCLLEIINEQVAESDVRFEIVEADPLIVWHFDELINPQKIQLAINAIADEDCINQAVSVALARQIIFSQAEIDYKNVVLALLFIPLLALLFVLIDIFTKHNTHNRKEIDYLVRYIKSHIHKGVPLWKIRAHLLQNGHDKNDVKEAEKLNAKNVVHKYTQYFNISIHEFFLLFLIILNLLDFLQILSGDIDYFKKILSFVILGYLLLRVSVTSILIGKRILSIDILLLFSFFAMTIKNLVGFAKNAIHEVNFVQDLYAFMWRENKFFEVTLFITGILGLLIATILLAREIPRSPSLVDTFLKKQHFLKRIFLIHLLLVTFFITVFNLMFEWLAIAVDSFVLITTIVIVIFLLIKHHKRLSPSEVLEEIAEDSEKLYEKVLYLFHYKKFLPLAFSAMLILYVLTEIANFLIPYLTGIYSVIYFGSFDTLHRPLFYLQDFLNPEYSLFANQIQFISLFDSILVFFAYALNVIAMLYLLILPARFWWHHYTQRKLPFFEKTHFILGKKELALFVTSILVFFARPIFEMQNLRTYDIIGGVHTLVGVDILTKPIILSNLDITLLLAALSGLIFYILAIFYKKAVNHVVLFFSLGFFTYYITIFFTSQFSYYLEMIRILLLSNILLAIYFILFALATALCIYGIGYITILYLYLPTPLQNFIHKHSLTIAFLKHQSHHHVHNKTVSKDSEKDIETYITKSLASKHELFYIIEHLEEKGYSIEDIETGIHKAISDKELLKGKDHINHYHHNKELIKALHTYIKKEYKKRDLKDIIDDVLKRSFTPKELLGGLQHLHTIAKPDDQLAQQLLTNPLTLFKLSKRKNIDTKVVIATLKTFHPIQIDLLTKALIHRLYRKYPSLQDILLHAKDFRFTEEDVRLALYHIHPKNASDTEILKYI